MKKMTNDQAAQHLDALVNAADNPESRAKAELLREYLLNSTFRANLKEYTYNNRK